MSGSNIALDTNQAVAVLNDVATVMSWLSAYQVLSLPVPVIGELRFGALNSGRVEANQKRIDGFLGRCQVLDVRAATAARYAEIRRALKSKGRPIPSNDLWIAAICIERDLPIATNDAHFNEVDGLEVLSPPSVST